MGAILFYNDVHVLDKGVYIGCYNNHSPDPDLNSSSVYWTDNNVDKCVRYCAEKS